MDVKRTCWSISAVAGIVIAGWLTGAGPVAAHEGTVTTVPAASATPAAPLGEPTGEGILFGRAEYVPAPVLAGSAAAPADEWSELLIMVAGTGVIAAGAAAVAVRRRRIAGGAWPDGAQVAGAGALLFAGVAHVVLAPSHWAEGWYLGAFFAASGVVLAVQGGLLYLRPSRNLYRSVVVTTAAMVVLYVAVRQAALPLINHQDPYLLTDIPVKLAELFAANVALTALAKLRTPKSAPAPQLAGAYS
jgi:hypothetical protein